MRIEKTQRCWHSKDKFKKCTKLSEKRTILSILPSKWSYKKIEDEFGLSSYMASSIKKLVNEKDIFSNLNPKPRKTLNEITAELVVNFYILDEVSRMMLRKKDCV